MSLLLLLSGAKDYGVEAPDLSFTTELSGSGEIALLRDSLLVADLSEHNGEVVLLPDSWKVVEL